MANNFYKILILFGKDDLWTKKNLLRSIKDERMIDEVISLGYIKQCSVTDLGEPQYRITALGIKIRDN